MTQPTDTGNAPESLRERIDNGDMTAGILIIIGLCFVLNMLDGFDIVCMAVAAPNLAEAWGLSEDQRGYILSAALVGMTLGAMLLAPLCDRYGRRRMIIASALLTGVAMIITGLLPRSLMLMIGLRIITGLGVGVILATTTAVATEFTPERWRNFIVPLVISGYPFGATVVSPVAQHILPNYGWESLFMFGGLMTLIAAFAAFLLLPESVSFMASQTGRRGDWRGEINKALAFIGRAPVDEVPISPPAPRAGRISTILTVDYRADTLKLWLAFFAGFLSLYFLLSWIPSLFVISGLSRAEGIDALFFFNLGGVLGIYLLGVITTKLRLGKTISAFYFIATACMVYFAMPQLAQPDSLNWLVFIMGLGIHGAFTGMYSVAARVYAVTERATGIGWAIGLGRAGAIISPAIAGILLAAGWTMYPMFILFAGPILIAAGLMATMKV